MAVLTENIGSPNREDVAATLDTDTGLLTISGAGAIKDFDMPADYKPVLFKDQTIRKIVVEEGITRIGMFTLFLHGVSQQIGELTRLEEVDFPDSLTELGMGACMGLTATKYISIPDINLLGNPNETMQVLMTPRVISRTAWSAETVAYYYTYLQRANIQFSDCVFDQGSQCVFRKTDSGYIYVGLSETMPESISTRQRYDIPETCNGEPVVGIDAYAGFGYYDIGNIYVGKNVTTIADNAFARNDLSGATIHIDNYPDSIPGAPWGSINLTIEWLPDTAIYIGSPVEKDVAARLEEGVLTISGTGKTIDFEYGKPLYTDDRLTITKVIVEDGITGLGKHMFDTYENLTDVTLPDSLEGELYFTFSRCVALKSIAFPPNITTYGVCQECTGLETVALKEGITRIGPGSFYNCAKLTKINFPSTIQTIEAPSFQGCTSLEEVHLKSGSVIDTAFNGINLKKVTLGSGVNEIKNGAFAGNKELTELVIEEGLQKLYLGSFGNCSALQTVVLPQSMTGIDNPFPGCTAMQEVTIKSKTAVIIDAEGAFGSATTIRGYIGSTAQAYAQKYSLRFLTIDILQSIQITSLPAKTDYAPGEELDTTGMVVTAFYDTGAEQAVTDYTITGYDSTKTGQQAITVTYQGLTTQLYVFVGSVLPTGIVVTRYPDKRLYALGETFDSTGLAVSLIYNSGKTEPVTDYALSGYDSGTVGIKTINVAYTPPAIDGQVVDILQTTFTVTVTKYGNNPFESDTSRKGMRIHWLDRPYTDVTNKEIEPDSFSLDQSICSDSSFRFGGCISSKFECKIFSDQFLDPDTYPDGKIQVYLQAGNEEVKVFTGVIDTADRTDDLNIRRIVAYDELKTKGGINLKEFGAYVSKFSPGVDLLRKELLKYLGIEEIRTNLMYDAAMIPFNFDYSSLTALQLLKDICVNNMVWGWINPDGVFEYIKLPPNAYWKDGKHNYYTPEEVLTGLIKPATFKEGRIWYPYRFALNPDPYYPVDVGVEIPDLKAYEDNVYFIDNSPLVGDYDWISQVYKEKTTYDPVSGFGSTTYELAGPIVLGPHFEQDDYSHRYLAREYTCKVKGNPYRKIGTNIQFNVTKQLLDGRELTWTINSYIMSRKMTSANGLFIDIYSARNGPYNPPAYGAKKETKGNTRDIGKLKKNMPRWKVYDGSGQSTEITVETGSLQGAYVMQAGQYNADNYQQGVIYYLYEE